MVANAKLGRESESSLDGYGGICMCKSIDRQEKKLVLIHVLNYLSDKNLTLDFFLLPTWFGNECKRWARTVHFIECNGVSHQSPFLKSCPWSLQFTNYLHLYPWAAKWWWWKMCMVCVCVYVICWWMQQKNNMKSPFHWM